MFRFIYTMISKKSLFISILTLLFLFQLALVLSSDLTGKVITTPVGMSITVESDVASISITSPENKTYLINESLNLSYLVANEDTVWYNLDNSANITITDSTLFNVTTGQHTLYLYANSSLGNLTIENVTFNADPSRFNIIYNEYEGNDSGDSTNFRQIAFEDLQNKSGIILENSIFGKIIFNEYINISEDENPSDNILDLDSNLEISDNLIILNSTALPNFNKSATLSLYNLSFSNPRILMDGSVCPESVCIEISYSENILEFNVTHFTSFSAEETPAVVTTPDTPSGSGRSTRFLGDSFSLSTETISATVKVGKVTTKEIIVTNLDNKNLNFDVEIQGLEDLIIVRPNKFTLSPKESKTISLDFIARENQIPEHYLGKVIFKAGDKTTEVLISVDVESQQKLFDINIKILKDYHIVVPGSMLITEIELFNMGDTEKIDAEIEYFIKDESGNTIDYHKDTKAVMTTLSFIREFDLSEDIKPGQYILYVKVSYNGDVASAGEWFSVIEKSFPMKKINRKEWTIWASGIIILLVLISVIFIIIKYKKKRKRH